MGTETRVDGSVSNLLLFRFEPKLKMMDRPQIWKLMNRKKIGAGLDLPMSSGKVVFRTNPFAVPVVVTLGHDVSCSSLIDACCSTDVVVMTD